MSYYKLVKDLVEKISKNSSSSTRFILLIFSTRYFNSNLKLHTTFKRYGLSLFIYYKLKGDKICKENKADVGATAVPVL